MHGRRCVRGEYSLVRVRGRGGLGAVRSWERGHRVGLRRRRESLFTFRGGLELVQPFRIPGQADSVAVLLSLAGVTVDGRASVFEVRHEAAFGWAVSALSVCDGSVCVR